MYNNYFWSEKNICSVLRLKIAPLCFNIMCYFKKNISKQHVMFYKKYERLNT